MNCKGIIGSKEGDVSSICWQGQGISFLSGTQNNSDLLSSKRKKQSTASYYDKNVKMTEIGVEYIIFGMLNTDI